MGVARPMLGTQMASDVDRGKLLTPKEIEAKYGIKRSWLYAWIKARRITHVKPSHKSVLIYENDLLKFLESREVKAKQRQRK